MLSKNVCDLKYSIRLYEFGLRYKSLFVWEYFNEDCFGIKFFPFSVVPDELNNFKIFHAYLGNELLEIFPRIIDIQLNKPFNNFRLNISKFLFVKEKEQIITYSVKYICDTHSSDGFPVENKLHGEYDENFSNALSKMLIYLLEKNYVKIEV